MTTLHRLTSSAFFTARDFSNKPMSLIVGDTQKRYEVGQKISPDAAALEFYFYAHWHNHVSATYHKHQPLDAWTSYSEKYVDMGSALANRMFHYLMLICTRETRHGSYVDSKKTTMSNKFGDKSWEYFTQYQKTSKPQACDSLFNIAKHWPDVTIGTYTTWMEWMFRRGKFSPGYGGKAWAEIAEILRKFVHGEVSAEIMIDLAFNSAHNNGPIFNKGMLFDAYSHHFVHLLDVQRAGQIPNLIQEYVTHGKIWFDAQHSVASLPEHLIDDSDLLGPHIETKHVDWYQVQALGAVKNHMSAKKYQDMHYGLSPEQQAKIDAINNAKPVEYVVTKTLSVPVLKRNADNHFSAMTVGDLKEAS
jgi:hypothetical protein